MRTLTMLAAVMGLLAVLSGTFAAHGITFTDAEHEAWWHTGARYHMVHALAMFAAAWAADRFSSRAAIAAGWLFLAGAVIFAGSLYLLAVSDQLFGSTQRWLGAITPIGGVSMIAGWVCLAVAPFTRPK